MKSVREVLARLSAATEIFQSSTVLKSSINNLTKRNSRVDTGNSSVSISLLLHAVELYFRPIKLQSIGNMSRELFPFRGLVSMTYDPTMISVPPTVLSLFTTNPKSNKVHAYAIP